MPPFLAKHDVLLGRRCPRALWLELHDSQRGDPISDGLRYRFAQSRRVAEAFRALHTVGTEVVEESDFSQAVARTTDWLGSGEGMLFDAAFAAGGVAVRVDILRRSCDGALTLVEVKATKGVRPRRHDAELAVQWWVAARSGAEPARAELLHLARGDDGPASLFAAADRTVEVRALLPAVQEWVARAIAVRSEPEEPLAELGAHCRVERGDLCRFWQHCSRDLPRPNVLDLPGLGWDRRWRLLGAGRAALGDILPGDLPAHLAHRHQAHLRGERWVDRGALRTALQDWRYPLVHLDFECWSPAFPAVPGTAPYTRLPVQFSLHMEREHGAVPEHHEYLHEADGDPRPAVAARLSAVLRAYPEATLVAYHAEFERQCLGELARAATADDEQVLRAARRRVRDPQRLVEHWVYDPAFGASFSIKRVAPALLGPAFGYGGLAVQDGEAAMARYEAMRTEPDPGRRDQFAAELRAYCRQDTLSMLHLVRWLREAAGLTA